MLPTMVMRLRRFGGTGGSGASICGWRSAPPPLPGAPQPRRGNRGAPRRLLPPPLPRASCRDCSRTIRSCSSSMLLAAPSSRRLSSIACASMEASSCTDRGITPCCQTGGSMVFGLLLASRAEGLLAAVVVGTSLGLSAAWVGVLPLEGLLGTQSLSLGICCMRFSLLCSRCS